jgi:hypothetical protein
MQPDAFLLAQQRSSAPLTSKKTAFRVMFRRAAA